MYTSLPLLCLYTHYAVIVCKSTDLEEMCSSEWILTIARIKNHQMPCKHFPDFISHSVSREQLKFIFTDLLPDLSGKLVLDVGSRLGPILYGVNTITHTIIYITVSAIALLMQQCTTEYTNWIWQLIGVHYLLCL